MTCHHLEFQGHLDVNRVVNEQNVLQQANIRLAVVCKACGAHLRFPTGDFFVMTASPPTAGPITTEPPTY